jgi:hypothetical protein
MPYYLIGLYQNSSNKLLTSKTFSASTLAQALTDAASDTEFTSLGTIPGTNTPRAIENATTSYINVLLLLIQAAYYASINAALSGFNVIAGQYDDTSPTQATENNVAPLRITSYRAGHVNLRDNSGNEIATTTTPAITKTAGTTKTILKVAIDSATSGDTTPISAPTGGLSIKIIKLWLQNAGGTDVLIILKDGSTTIHKVLLKANCANDYYFNGSVGKEEITLTAETAFNVNLSASFQIYGFVIYRTDA